MRKCRIYIAHDALPSDSRSTARRKLSGGNGRGIFAGDDEEGENIDFHGGANGRRQEPTWSLDAGP